MRGKTGPKRSKTQREIALAETARLDRRGYNQHQIANIMGVSQPQVAMDLKTLRKRYAELSQDRYEASVGEVLEQYRDVLCEAWEAWEKSKQDAVTTVTEQNKPRARKDEEGNPVQVEDGELETVRVTTTRAGRIPHAPLLDLVKRVIDAKRQLQGLDQPAKVDTRNLNVNVGVGVDWDALAKAPDKELRDAIEDKLQALEAEVVAYEQQKALESQSAPNPNGLKELGDTNGEAH